MSPVKCSYNTAHLGHDQTFVQTVSPAGEEPAAPRPRFHAPLIAELSILCHLDAALGGEAGGGEGRGAHPLRGVSQWQILRRKCKRDAEVRDHHFSPHPTRPHPKKKLSPRAKYSTLNAGSNLRQCLCCSHVLLEVAYLFFHIYFLSHE